MTQTLDELEAAIRDMLDWRSKIRRKPWLYAGIALAAGFVISGGPIRALRDVYYLVRPSAKLRAQANQSLLQLQETLDDTLPGLPAGVIEQARDLRLTIRHTEPDAHADSTLVIQQKPSTLDQVAVRAAEVAASTAAALLTKRLLDEMDGKTPSKT